MVHEKIQAQAEEAALRKQAAAYNKERFIMGKQLQIKWCDSQSQEELHPNNSCPILLGMPDASCRQ